MSRVETESLCKIGSHWCTECCEGMSCSNLGELPDDSWGCLGHALDKPEEMMTPDGLVLITPQPKYCRMVSCEDDLPDEVTKDSVIQAIQSLPPGEFCMSMVVQSIQNH